MKNRKNKGQAFAKEQNSQEQNRPESGIAETAIPGTEGQRTETVVETGIPEPAGESNPSESGTTQAMEAGTAEQDKIDAGMPEPEASQEEPAETAKTQTEPAETTAPEKKKSKTLTTILLSVAVIASLAALGVYAWNSAMIQPTDSSLGKGVTPLPTQVAATAAPTATSAPTQTPTPAPTTTPTPTPKPSPTPFLSSAPSPAPIPKSMITPIPKLPFEPAKALYLAPGTVRNSSTMDHFIDLANKTEINAYVIDIKNDDGTIQYKSELPDVLAAGAYTADFDVRKLIQKLHDNNIRVIGRVVTFKDSRITKYRPDMAIYYNGNLFKSPESNGGSSMWLDATNPDSWEYVASVVCEAVNFGFDEIQFDYIRFPETSLYQYDLQYQEEGKERHEYIEGFLAYVREQLPQETVLSADVFGMPLISSRDYGEIGQTLETIGWNLNYISPMIYPSHYANSAQKGSMSNKVGQTINGVKFTHPDLKPYEIVLNTLLVGKKRIEALEGYQMKCRPYIQGFTASYLPSGYWMEYGVEQYRAQIQAVYDAGYEEWIFWNSGSKYMEDAFLPEEE